MFDKFLVSSVSEKYLKGVWSVLGECLEGLLDSVRTVQVRIGQFETGQVGTGHVGPKKIFGSKIFLDQIFLDLTSF